MKTNRIYNLSDKYHIIQSNNYKCSNCNISPNEIYIINDKVYPIIHNFRIITIDCISYHIWDEEHICSKCNTRYWFENSEY